MLERKAVIEARKEYLESLHVKRASVHVHVLFLATCGCQEQKKILLNFIFHNIKKSHGCPIVAYKRMSAS